MEVEEGVRKRVVHKGNTRAASMERTCLWQAACLQIVVARLLVIRHADVEGTICIRG